MKKYTKANRSHLLLAINKRERERVKGKIRIKSERMGKMKEREMVRVIENLVLFKVIN